MCGLSFSVSVRLHSSLSYCNFWVHGTKYKSIIAEVELDHDEKWDALSHQCKQDTRESWRD